MKSPKLRVDYARLSDADLELKADAVVAAFNEHMAVFDSPNPPLPDFNTAVIEYTTALTNAQTRDKTMVAIKNAKRVVLLQMMAALANYVMNKANGDETILVMSGFDLARPGVAKPPIGVPENFSIKNGINEGQVVCSVSRVQGANSYIHEYTPDPLTPTSEWKQEFTTQCKCTISDLQPGQKYWFRVAAVGPRKQVTYTNAQVRMVA